MVELEIVHIADGNRVVKQLTCAAIVDRGLAVGGLAGLCQQVTDVILMCTIEHRGHHLEAQRRSGVAKIDLQHLSDVHTRRHAQGVQHNIQRCAIRQERHILTGQDAGNHALVAVAAGHLIAHADLALLGDIAANHHIDTRAELVAILAGKDLHIHNDTVLAVRYTQGGIPHLARLLTEDRPQQPLLRCQLGLALRGHLTDQDIAAAHLGADADNAALVQILQRVIAHIGDIAGDLLRPQLGIAGFHFVFLNVDGGVYIIPHDLLVDQNGILVIVALPGHKADQGVLAQRNLAIAGGRTVSHNLTLIHMLPHADHRALIDAGALVGAGEFDQLIHINLAAVIPADLDRISRNILHRTGRLGQDAYAGVHAGLVFHTGTDNGAFRRQQRHCLPLHVGAHQSTVGVVVLQEGDHSRGHRYNHLRRNIHVVHDCGIFFLEFAAVAGGNLGADKAVVLVQRLIGLRHDVVILHIRRHIGHLIGHHAGGLIHLAVGRLHKAVLIDTGKGRQIGDQTDVGAFRGLDRAHTAVVAVVHIAHLKSGAVTGQAAGAEGRQTALVLQLGQRVVLIHELGQRRGTEEFLNGRHHRTDIDQRLRCHHIHILALQGHALTHHPLHTGETNAELVLQQLTHRTDAAVAQVVDIIGIAKVVAQAIEVVDGSQNVLHRDVVRDQLTRRGKQCSGQLLIGQAAAEDLLQHGVAHPLIDGLVHRLIHGGADILGQIHHAVGNDLDLMVLAVLLHEHIGHGHAGILDLHRTRAVDDLAGLRQNFPGRGVGDGTADLCTGQTVRDTQLLIVLVATHAGQIVAAGIEEEVIQVFLRILHRGRLTRTQLAVDLQQRLLAVLGRILLQRGQDAGILTEEFQNLRIGAQAQRPRQHGHRDLAVFINAHIEHIGGVGLILQPGTAVRDHGGGKQLLAQRIVHHIVVHARRTDQLRNDHTLGAVDHKGAAVGHKREIAHEHLGLLDFAGLLIEQAHAHMQRGGIGHIPLLALLNGIFRGIIQTITDKIQYQIAVIIGDGRRLVKDLPQALLQEPLVGIFLHLNEVGHFQHFVDLGEAHAHIVAQLYRFDIRHKARSLLS